MASVTAIEGRTCANTRFSAMLPGNNISEEISCPENPDDEKWVIDVTDRITDSSCIMSMTRSTAITINRVPKFLFLQKSEAYIPRVVSLGIFNRQMSQPMSQMDRLKAVAVQRMTYRLNNQSTALSELIQSIESMVSEIRVCYEEETECENKTLALIFTLDGCFVLEILRLLPGEPDKHLAEYSHPIFNANRVKSCQFDMLSDFLMLENQIPITVLIKLLEVEVGSAAEAKKQLLRILGTGLIAETHPFLPNWLNRADLVEARLVKFEDLEKHKHILGLFQSMIAEDPREKPEIFNGETNRARLVLQGIQTRLPRLRGLRKERSEGHYETLMASAAEFHKAGMRFKQYYGVPSAEEMRFSKTTLFLPTIWITDTTEVILRNLIALEVCQESQLTVISYYVFFLNSLIESEADVGVLRRAGILQSSMGTDKEVVDLLNGVAKGIKMNSLHDPFMKLKCEVNGWYRSSFQIQIAEYKDKHPMFWRNFSIFWGILLLLVAAAPTIIQVCKDVGKYFEKET